MSVSVIVNGQSYVIPQSNEVGWGVNLTAWIQAISSNISQKTGGSFTLSGELDYGPNFGIKVLYVKTETALSSLTGVIRLANSDAISWRNSGNTADLALKPDADGILQYNGVDLVNLSASQTLTNKTLSGASNTFSSIPGTAVAGVVHTTGDTMSGALNMGGSQVNNMASPSVGTDAVNKNYVDNKVTGLAWRPEAQLYDNVHTTTPTTTATLIDSVTVTNGMRVLFTALATNDNDIYIATISGSAITWTIATDGQSGTGAPTPGDTVLITQGTTYANSVWGYSGSTSSWVQVNGAGQIQAGTGLSKSGNTLSLSTPVSAANGGIGTSGAAFTGVLKASAGTFSASALVDADVSSSAAIARSKLASGTANQAVINDGSGNFSGVSPGSSGNVLQSNGTTWISAAPSAATYRAPTIQKFNATGTTTGWLFTISTSTTCAVGDTYTNNANTYTVLGALSAQTGQVLFCSGASAPTGSGTLTRATGAGTASVTFTAATALATYTAPTSPAPLYLKVKSVGGGGGGAGSGTGGIGSGGNGTTTAFGANLILCGGGQGGQAQGNGIATGGSASVGTAAGIPVAGAAGGGQSYSGTSSVNMTGGMGGASPFGGAGAGSYATAGSAAAANSGSGGAGGGTGSVSSAFAGAGGASGGYAEAVIPSPAGTYYYCVGSGGVAGGLGASGANGSAGAAGVIIVEECYQ